MKAHGLLAAGLVVLGPALAARAAVDPELAVALEVGGGADVVAIDLPALPGAPHVRAATLVRASPTAIGAALLDPSHFRAVIPAMIRSDVESGGPPLPAGARRIGWELEVPLFNLKGHLVLRQLPDGVEMLLTDGDLSPGHVTFHVQARPDGRSILEADGVIDVRRSSFFLRAVMERSPLGEPAAMAAAVFVALRGTALRAEHAGEAAAFRPTGPFVPSDVWPPQARAFADPRLGPLWGRGALAFVARAASERLAGVSVAGRVAASPELLGAALRDPERWAAFPGWRKIQVSPPMVAKAPPTAAVEDSIPFVDLDATWEGQPGPQPRWIATAGAARGARLGWDVVPLEGAPSIVVLRLYPRLEQTGGIPRRFIESEPLLEHGLALAMAFANAWGAIGSWNRTPAKPR
jgi:hypothetical protein